MAKPTDKHLIFVVNACRWTDHRIIGDKGKDLQSRNSSFVSKQLLFKRLWKSLCKGSWSSCQTTYRERRTVQWGSFSQTNAKKTIMDLLNCLDENWNMSTTIKFSFQWQCVSSLFNGFFSLTIMKTISNTNDSFWQVLFNQIDQPGNFHVVFSSKSPCKSIFFHVIDIHWKCPMLFDEQSLPMHQYQSIIFLVVRAAYSSVNILDKM